MRTRLAVLLLGLAGCAPRLLHATTEPEYRGWEGTLPGGARLVVYAQPAGRRFVLGASYGGGTSADPVGQEGTALLAARLAGRARPGGVSLAARALAAGSVTHSEVTRYDLAFGVTGRPAALREALLAERDRMRDPLAGVTEEEFLEAREALALELALERDRGSEEVHLSALLGVALPGDPGARHRGAPESVRALSLGALREWARRQLSPRNLVLVLAGPGRPEELAGLVAATLADAGAEGAPRPEEPAPPGTVPAPSAELASMRETSDGPRLWLAWVLPVEAAADVVTAGAVEAKVRIALTRRAGFADLKGLVRGVSFHSARTVRNGIVAASVGLHADRDAEYVSAMLVPEAEQATGSVLSQAVTSLAADWAGRRAYLEGGDVDALVAARWFRVSGQADYLAARRALLERIARDGLPARVLASFARGAARRLLVLPIHPAPPADPEAESFLAGATWDPPRLEGPAPGPPGVRALLGEARPPIQRRTLANGLEVVVVSLAGSPRVTARLVLRVPIEGTPPFPPGLAATALESAEHWWTAFGSAPCLPVHRIRHREGLSFQVGGSLAGLPQMLEALRCATASRTVGPRFEQARDALAAALRAAPPSWGRAAGALYPGHPYGGAVDPEALRTARPADAARWMEGVLRPEVATLIVAGDVRPSPELDQVIDEAFGGWRGSGAPLGEAPPSPMTRRRVLLFATPGLREHAAAATVTTIAVGVRLPAGDREADRALPHLLAEHLRQALPRDVPSAATLAGHRLDQVLWVGARCAPSQTARVSAVVLDQIARLGGGAPTEEEAARARWLTATARTARHDTVALAVEHLGAAAVLGEPLDDDALVESLATLSASRLAGEARRLAAGREVVVILGDRNLVPALQAEGLAVEVVEPPPGAKAKP